VGDRWLGSPRPLQGEADRVHDGIDVVRHFVVGEAQDVPASSLEPGAADPVLFGNLVGVVRRAVDLDDEPTWPAGEVHDVGTDGLLATEAEACRVATEEPPEASLGVGGLAAHAPGVADQPGVASWHDTEVSDAIVRFKGSRFLCRWSRFMVTLPESDATFGGASSTLPAQQGG